MQALELVDILDWRELGVIVRSADTHGISKGDLDSSGWPTWCCARPTRRTDGDIGAAAPRGPGRGHWLEWKQASGCPRAGRVVWWVASGGRGD